MQTIEQLLAKIAIKGCLVSKLFQLDYNTWRAELQTSEAAAIPYGQGPTAYYALLAAIENIPAPVVDRSPAYIGWGKPKITGAELLRRIGL